MTYSSEEGRAALSWQGHQFHETFPPSHLKEQHNHVQGWCSMKWNRRPDPGGADTVLCPRKWGSFFTKRCQCQWDRPCRPRSDVNTGRLEADTVGLKADFHWSVCGASGKKKKLHQTIGMFSSSPPRLRLTPVPPHCTASCSSFISRNIIHDTNRNPRQTSALMNFVSHKYHENLYLGNVQNVCSGHVTWP